MPKAAGYELCMASGFLRPRAGETEGVGEASGTSTGRRQGRGGDQSQPWRRQAWPPLQLGLPLGAMHGPRAASAATSSCGHWTLPPSGSKAAHPTGCAPLEPCQAVPELPTPPASPVSPVTQRIHRGLGSARAELLPNAAAAAGAGARGVAL